MFNEKKMYWAFSKLLGTITVEFTGYEYKILNTNLQQKHVIELDNLLNNVCKPLNKIIKFIISGSYIKRRGSQHLTGFSIDYDNNIKPLFCNWNCINENVSCKKSQ